MGKMEIVNVQHNKVYKKMKVSVYILKPLYMEIIFKRKKLEDKKGKEIIEIAAVRFLMKVKTSQY